MNDEQLQQRIKYLIEHGGLWRDPLDEIKRLAMTGLAFGILALGVHLGEWVWMALRN